VSKNSVLFLTLMLMAHMNSERGDVKQRARFMKINSIHLKG